RGAGFASGTGSNFHAFMRPEAIRHHIALLVCDNRHPPDLEKASLYDASTSVFEPTHYPTKEAYEQAIMKRLKALNIEWIFLAGYMRLIVPTILQAYEGKIVNIHPSLLPQFIGKGAIIRALDARANVS